jgi:hypothetical protein
MRGRRRPLRLREFLIAQSAAFLGDSLILAAFPLIAIHLERNAAAVAAVGFAGTLPQVVMALPAGVIVDRRDRCRLMAAAAAATAAVLLMLTVLTGAGGANVSMLEAVAFLVGCGQILISTAGSALMPAMASGDHLQKANAKRFAAQQMSGLLVGPPLAGILIAVTLVLPVGAACICYLGVAVLLQAADARDASGANGTPRSAGRLRALGHEVIDGLKIVARHPQLRAFTVMTGVFNVASEAVFVLLVLYSVAPGPLGLSRWGFGVLLSCFAAGGLAGAALSGAIGSRIGLGRALIGSYVMMAIGLAGPSFTTSSVAAGASFVLAGAAVAQYNVICASFRQASVPSALLGRVSASYGLIALGGIPLGAALAGIAAHAIGVRSCILAAGGVVLLGMLAVRPLVRLRMPIADPSGREAAGISERCAPL